MENLQFGMMIYNLHRRVVLIFILALTILGIMSILPGVSGVETACAGSGPGGAVGLGDQMILQVTYDSNENGIVGDAGDEVTDWNHEVIAVNDTTTVPGHSCYVDEVTFPFSAPPPPGPPLRSSGGLDVMVEPGAKSWIDDTTQLPQQALASTYILLFGVWISIPATQTYVYTNYDPGLIGTGMGAPFEEGESWDVEISSITSAATIVSNYTVSVTEPDDLILLGGKLCRCAKLSYVDHADSILKIEEWWITGPAQHMSYVRTCNAGNFAAQEDSVMIWADPSPAVPEATFSSATYSIDETVSTATIEVILSHPGLNTITIDYTTSDGTAMEPGDYAASSGTLTFVPGDVSETFDVTIFDDVDVEGDEILNLELSSPVEATVGSPGTATLTIVDDESNPEVSFSAASYEVDEGVGVATIAVTLSKPSWQPITIDYATSDGTAMEPGDYAASTGTLTFVPGDVSETFDVTIVDDLVDEDSEELNLVLSNPVNAILIPPDTAVLTIFDNDGIRVPDDYPTIQAAINAAVDGDTIIVADGTYTGTGNRDLEFFGKAITLRSENGPENCIIDCQASVLNYHRGFHIRSGEGPDSVLDGFTITNGYQQYGGGIQCKASSPTIKNCIFLNNRAVGFPLLGLDPPRGGGMYCFANSSPILTHCKFLGNKSVRDWGMNDGYGGGFECLNSTPTLINCVFSGNIAGTNGGGVYNWNSSTVITNCTFTGNIANTVGDDIVPNMLGGGAMYNYAGGNPIITNCIIYGNDALLNNDDEIKEVGVFGFPQVWATVTYSNVRGGWSGTGNINADPLFEYEYYLSMNSPCIDAGSNDAVPAGLTKDIEGEGRMIDGDGNGSVIVDMGADEYTVRCADLDGDGDVDGADLAILADSFGYSVGDPAYNWIADLDGNGTVDEDDLAILAAQLGRTSCP